MAFSISRPRFPRFQDSKNYFKTGIGGENLRVAAAPAAAPSAAGTTTIEAPTTPPATAPGATGGGGLSPVQGFTGPSVSQPSYQAPEIGGIGAEGTLQQRLFQPSLQARETGQMQLGEFADIFRQEAGPERTYGGIGGQQTLESAVQGGPMTPAQELVGAQYRGPTTLDPQGIGGLQHLAGQLQTRRGALGTGQGVTSILQSGIPGLTLGEAKYSAQKDIFADPTYRAQLAEALGPAGQFGQEITTAREAAEELAQKRTAQEADIAQQARGYLGERQAGIGGEIGSEVERLQEQGLQYGELAGKVQGAEDFRSQLGALGEAQAAGLVGQDVDLSEFDTATRQAMEAAPQVKESIMAKYGTVADLPLGVPGVGKRGLGSPHVRDPQTGELKDYRDVIPKELQKDWTARQAELEKAFNPLRQKWMEKYPEFDPDLPQNIDPGLLQTVSPLYYGGPEGGALFGDKAFGGDFQAPQLANFLQFDPGMRPSRGNVSTDEQRGQFNRISDLLGSLDKIEKTDLFRAASIGVGIQEYLDAEADALEAQGEKVGTAGQSWKKQVATLRKKAKKAAKKAEWAKVGTVIGSVLGAAVGGVIGGPGGAVVGTGIGGGLGGQAAGSLA